MINVLRFDTRAHVSWKSSLLYLALQAALYVSLKQICVLTVKCKLYEFTQRFVDIFKHVSQDRKLGGKTREKTITDYREDPEKYEETQTRAIIRAMVNKLNKEWFSGVTEDKDDLEGIIDYQEPTLYDGFIDYDDEAYKQRRNNLLGMPYTKPPPGFKEEAEIRRYNLVAGERLNTASGGMSADSGILRVLNGILITAGSCAEECNVEMG
nr:hypothetical protein [Tanacetum cinerariifolium]